MLERKLKTALDESRLLILGAQVLFGMQFECVFQQGFAELPSASRAMLCIGLLSLLLSVGLLIAPSLYHQIVYVGESRVGALRSATWFAACSLLPLTLGLGLSAYVIFARLFGAGPAIAAGLAFTLIALALLYGLGWVLKRGQKEAPMPVETGSTPLSTKIEQALTEARVIIPGGQALLGFQFIAVLTQAFSELPARAQALHAAGLCAVALAVALLMTPAAVHRIAYGGEDSESFFRLAGALVVAATVPLAAGITADVYVVLVKVTGDDLIATVVALAALATLAVLWLLYPLYRRGNSRASPFPATGQRQHG